MPSERVQRRIDSLLDEADEAIAAGDWSRVRTLCDSVLRLDPDNEDARAYLEASGRDTGVGNPSRPAADALPETIPRPEALEGRDSGGASVPIGPGPSRTSGHGENPTPTSFANDRYTVSKFLGEGGKKRVYLAHDTLLDREVAFALIKTEGFDETARSRITREAQAMGRLGTHPNIVTVFDLGVEGDEPYMVTELMAGGDIEGLLSGNPVGAGSGPPTRPTSQSSVAAGGAGPAQGGGNKEPSPWEGEGLGVGRNTLPLERVIEIAKAVCEGLQFAHEQDVVHRDLKPGNVWLTSDGTAKIGDFGLAVMTDRSRLTREAMMVGTVSYMPPEQATGGEITARADLYSLGAMLYEMVTGRPPFLGDEEIAIIGQHINTAPVAPTWHNGDCPRPLEALIMRMLAKDPSERPDSARDVYNALDAIDLTARGETVEREANSLESLAGGVFVGRQAEMDQLKAALEDVLGGRGRLVTLVGEPGIGKTRTSEELATYAGLRGAQVLRGRCYEGGGAPPYWPWVQAIRSYVRDIEPEELRRQMGSSASVVAEIVTDVKDRLPDLQPPPQIDDPDSARFRLFDSITSFLKTASQSQPLIIVLDDLHWSDQPTLTFLEFIASELGQSRVLLLCTYRDMELNRRHPLSVTLGDLARERLYERVILRGLSEADIARFIGITAGTSAPAELSATIQRHTEGNPLFVTEVIRDLVQSGELTEEKLSGRSSWSVRIPEGVREVIGRRLDRLSDRANEIFITAAVIGREFTLAALRELAEETTEGQLLDVLDEALDAKLIEELPDEIGHYQFTHALVQETLTGELSSARKVRLHARIAESLQSLYGTSADEHAAELAPHFVEAELILGTDRSVYYSILAGERALAVTAPEQALVHFNQALASAGEGEMDSARARLFLGLGRALGHVAYGGPQVREAVEPLATAFEYYAAEQDQAKLEAIGLEPVLRLPGFEGSGTLLESILDKIGSDTAAAGIINARLAWWEGARGQFDRANDALSRALEISEQLDDPRVEIEARVSRYMIPPEGRSVTDLATGMAALDRAWELLKSSPDPVLESHISAHRALLSIRHGRLENVLAFAEVGYDLGTRIRYRAAASQSSSAGFYACAARGSWDDAGVWADREESAMSHLDWSLAVSWRAFVRALQEVPDFDETFRRCFKPPLSGQSGIDVYVLGHLAEICHAIPEGTIMEDLRATWIDVSEHATNIAVHPVLGPSAKVVIAMVAVTLQDRGSAPAAYASLSPLGNRLDIGISTDRVQGLLALLLDNREMAIRHFEEALTFCRKNGCLKELAWSCSDYAEMLLDRDDPSSASGISDREKATEIQDEALAITQELGMRPLTERILARREILRA